jgi:hypothetical protein
MRVLPSLLSSGHRITPEVSAQELGIPSLTYQWHQYHSHDEAFTSYDRTKRKNRIRSLYSNLKRNWIQRKNRIQKNQMEMQRVLVSVNWFHRLTWSN